MTADKQVQTALGPVSPADLGRTYVHEHVFVLTADVQQNYPGEWGDEQTRIDDAVQRLSALSAQGVRTIVDPTVIGLGRYLPRIRQVAERVPDLNIVTATGCYTYNDIPFFFSARGSFLEAVLGVPVEDPMVEFFVADIVEGNSGIKAGMLKCAIEAQGLTPGVERVMRAVAKAHLITGVPITVHTHPDSQAGLVVHKVMCGEEGVDPSRVVLGHSGDTRDVEHLTQLAELGFVLGMDRFGLNVGMTMEDRAGMVIEMCRRGFAGQMALSQDAACYIDWMDPRLLSMMPEWNYLHLHDTVLPYLRTQGVTEQQEHAMLVEVPRKFLAG